MQRILDPDPRSTNETISQHDILDLIRDNWALEELAVSYLESGFWIHEALLGIENASIRTVAFCCRGGESSPRRIETSLCRISWGTGIRATDFKEVEILG